MSKSTVSRRSFFKKSAAGLAGAGIFASGMDHELAGASLYLPKYPDAEDFKIKKYRPLGKLGFDASDISLGTTGATDPSIVSFALDCGINYIDTAYSYGNGKAERDIGAAIKDRREKIWINTKFNRSAFTGDNMEKSLMDSLDESLKRLKTDYVDSIMIHNGKPSIFQRDELHSMFSKAKQAGKVKYLGVSMHDDDVAEVFEKTVNDKRFDIILVIYGVYSSQSAEKFFKKAYEYGKAVTIMKTLGAAYNAKIKGWDKLNKQTRTVRGRQQESVDYTPAFMQSAFAWVLKNPYVSVLVKRMNSIDDVKNCLPASGAKFGAVHQQFLERYGSLIKGNYCKIGCGDCLSSCPNNIPINHILRYKMYFENYRSEKEGILCYKELPSENNANVCKDCIAPCTGACPLGVDIRSELLRAHEMLTV